MAKKKLSMEAVMDHDWEAENALDTLIKADEIMSDKKMMRRVKKKAAKRKKDLTKVMNNPCKRV